MFDLLIIIQQFFGILIAALAAMSCAGFFWGLVIYIVEGGDEAERVHAKRLVLGSVTAMLLLMLLWGVLSYLHLIGPQFLT